MPSIASSGEVRKGTSAQSLKISAQIGWTRLTSGIGLLWLSIFKKLQGLRVLQKLLPKLATALSATGRQVRIFAEARKQDFYSLIPEFGNANSRSVSSTSYMR